LYAKSTQMQRKNFTAGLPARRHPLPRRRGCRPPNPGLSPGRGESGDPAENPRARDAGRRAGCGAPADGSVPIPPGGP